MLTKGEGLSKKEEVASFLEKERAFLDALAVEEKLKALGMHTKEGKAKAVVTEGEEHSIVDNIMEEMDRELQKKDSGFKIDKELRKATMLY